MTGYPQKVLKTMRRPVENAETLHISGAGERSEVRGSNAKPPIAFATDILPPVSRIPHFKDEGDSGDVDEKKRGKSGVRYQVPGVSEKSEVRRENRRTCSAGGF
jgi:hypothetical protein